jgi:16S rRNA (guanine527-N7)-methyltransferase
LLKQTYRSRATRSSETETETVEPARIAALLAPFLGDATLSETQLTQVREYLDLLLRWNARINLTAVRHPEQIVTRHFGESFFAARHLYPSCSLEPESWRLVDIGSGAGFPGLPIKLWAPAIHATLLESNHRKATFLREVSRALQLANVEVITERAESYVERISEPKATGGAPGAAEILPRPGAAPARAPGPTAHNLTVTVRAVERFEEVLPTAFRLLENFPAAERRIALLIGSAQVATAHELAPALTWSDPVAIPQSSNRVLLIGSLSE